MKKVFADTSYWVALIDPKDKWHSKALKLSQSFTGVLLITTDEVLSEVLTFFSGYGPYLRERVTQIVFGILTNKSYVEVVEQSRESFLSGLALYEKRLDKAYSLTDCISMQLMRADGISEVLTSDKHFAQEGLVILLLAE
ncbi:MAG: type II toxin-antitoxin system VapC family toxin [Blastocatellia bacterium]